MIVYYKASDFDKFRSMYKKSLNWYLDLRRGLQYACSHAYPVIMLIAILNDYYGYRCAECYVECEIIKIRW